MKKLIAFMLIVTLATTICCIKTYAEGAPDVSCPSAILMDQTTGAILFEKNADEKRAPASVTKVMTLLLIMEAVESGKLEWDSPIAVSPEAAGMGGSQVYLKEGETMTTDEMVKCIAVVSANDCCVAMAEAISGSVSSFISKMNQRAKELGMKNTHFNSCTGLDTEDHYTTAHDIAIMSRELMKHEKIKDYSTIWMDTVRNGAFTLSNTNKLIRFYDGATGLKTGFTDDAGYCLSATATRESLSLIAVVLGGETSDKRFSDAKALLNFGFTQYKLYQESPSSIDPVRVIKGMEDLIQPQLAEQPAFLIQKGSEKSIKYKVELSESVLAPVDAGQKIGTITYTCNGKNIGNIHLIADKEIPKVTFGHLFFHIIEYFFT
ncbi:MAG: D-alanyl-D-alanine carboxypeptidase, partial [Clostridia bacterium]|nr:D-alanyl-D-alanine carboxypeptidase [Clostridia bacterium]